MIYYQAFKKLLSNQLLEYKNNDIKELIENQYNIKEWSKVINYFYELNFGRKQHFITKNNYLLCEKIKNEIGLELFPITKSNYLKAEDKSQGYAYFTIYDKDLNIYGSCYIVQDLLRKKNKLELWFTDEGENFIEIKR